VIDSGWRSAGNQPCYSLIDVARARIRWSSRLVNIVREILASEAKVHLPRLLDEVERGATLIITRHGRRIARIVPEPERRQEEIDKALASFCRKTIESK